MSAVSVPLAREKNAGLRALLVLAALLLLGGTWLPLGDPLPWPLRWLFTVLAGGVVWLMVAMPRSLGYVLTDEGLRVQRMSGTLTWPYADLKVLSPAGRLGLKVGGVGVPGYYSGNYSWQSPSGEVGPRFVQALASARQGGVLLAVRQRPYYLTPADPQAFETALLARGVCRGKAGE
ncbi:PH domain-containing protein [Deinococcus gobiensis]|uniref:Bacterial Pleckstrin homology domain-containing protein n=1 Tax=Deinococcus gobiensis (strain DSM 21396 / JCM 16679 / CGMCC 1.7299 / I-0) TaxID=745776 RepID=H8GWD0_DEIGI|nr:PH domain-containing protein [Deinococcus gobiensis]AFD25680.1 hypothetical protein DGo_CA1753 [Deinococcus gobiensis I-0]